MRPLINYREHCKVRIRNSDPSFDQHEVVKLIICLLYARKYRFAGIYTEQELINGNIVDVMIDLGQEKIYIEIQKEISSKWLESIKDRDLELDINTLVIPLKKLSYNINNIKKELGDYLV